MHTHMHTQMLKDYKVKQSYKQDLVPLVKSKNRSLSQLLSLLTPLSPLFLPHKPCFPSFPLPSSFVHILITF